MGYPPTLGAAGRGRGIFSRVTDLAEPCGYNLRSRASSNSARLPSQACRPVARICHLRKRHRHEDQDMAARKRSELRQALQDAKHAVRAYAREPSWANADAVEVGWGKVRQLDSRAQWRQPEATGRPFDRAAPVS
jgi:hypothetical protein